MKPLFFISAALISVSGFAQTECSSSSSNPLFKFDNAGSPKEVRKLGTSPEFPFLRNLSSPNEVYSALKRADRNNTRGMSQLNDLLMAAGFENGAKDVKKSDISTYYMPVGTEGNMGSGNYSTGYYTLQGDASEFKAWKISSGSCYVYIMQKCGNAFFPKNAGNKTACINVPVTLTGNMQEVTLNSDGQQMTTSDNVYVYYARKRHKRHETAYPIADVNAKYPSKPILLRSEKDVQSMPQTYKVSLSTPNNTVNVCPDSTLNIAANINVEKTSEYSGYYPNKNKKEYKCVSKRKYKRIARNMRKAERHERRVARLSGVKVNEVGNS